MNADEAHKYSVKFSPDCGNLSSGAGEAQRSSGFGPQSGRSGDDHPTAASVVNQKYLIQSIL